MQRRMLKPMPQPRVAVAVRPMAVAAPRTAVEAPRTVAAVRPMAGVEPRMAAATSTAKP